jgi:HD-like signal output (HDOD) protein
MTEQRSFIEIIKDHIDSGNITLPVFSSNAMRVQQELVKKEPNLKVIEQIISSDQSLSTQVLKMANSAFYKGLAEIKTIQAAIVRLGMEEIGRITLLAASQNQFRSSDKLLNLIMKQLWQHSVGCAIGTIWLARRCKLEALAGHAFFAGLLHDIGKLFVLLVLDQIKQADKSVEITEALVFEAMNSLHTEQGYNLMQKWSMPESYCIVARDHHLEEFDNKDMVLVLVRMSNTVCKKLGIGTESASDLVPSTSLEAGYLNVSELDLAELEIKLEDTAALSG